MEDPMNYRWSAVLILGTFMALPFGMVRADDAAPPAANEGDAHQWKHDEGRNHMDLGITDDQKAKLKTVREAQKTALRPLWRKQRDLTIKLHDQLEDKATDAAIERTLADIKANREAMKSAAERFQSQKDAIFTPTQRARMILVHEKMGHRHEGWREKIKDGQGIGRRDHDGDDRNDSGHD
jgi:Spy/CpxP family protein refolding chaperone